MLFDVRDNVAFPRMYLSARLQYGADLSSTVQTQSAAPHNITLKTITKTAPLPTSTSCSVHGLCSGSGRVGVLGPSYGLHLPVNSQGHHLRKPLEVDICNIVCTLHHTKSNCLDFFFILLLEVENIYLKYTVATVTTPNSDVIVFQHTLQYTYSSLLHFS